MHKAAGVSSPPNQSAELVYRRPELGQAVWKQREIAVLADSALGEAALES
jgi:hypothetical protein